MMKDKHILPLFLVWFFFLPELAGAFQKQAQSKKKKIEFGVVLNEDGDLAFPSPDPATSERMLRANVDGHAALGIQTYVFCVGTGSDVLLYPTKVSSTVGWRKTKYEDKYETWRTRTDAARKCIAAGLDAVQIAGSQAKKNDMFFIPSLRMNDAHFVGDPYDYPLTGKFWLDHTDLTIKESPLSFKENYSNLLDFSHAAVRDFRMAVVDEVIERNSVHMDGLELDFTRTHIFFPKGKADAGVPIMTDFVRQVRRKLDVLARQKRRPMHLFVRIPPSEASCTLAGLDISTWIKEGLVALVSPSQIMTLAQDMPIQNLTKLAHQYGVQMYPTLFPRTSYRVALDPAAADLGMKVEMNQDVRVPEALAAAANYRYMGVDGFYLFNYYGFPHPGPMYTLVAGLHAQRRNYSDKVFAATKTYFYDDVQPSYSYVKQLPKKIEGSATFTILVGELPQDAPFSVATCVLRLGLKDGAGPVSVLKLNGHLLTDYTETVHPKLYKGKAIPATMAERSLIFPINDLSFLKGGQNDIEVKVAGVTLTDIEIGYSYFNNQSKITFGTKAPALNSTITYKK